MRSARIRTYRQIRLFAALSFLVPAGLVLAGLLLAGTATTAGAQQNEAIQVVEKFHDSLLSVMKEAETLGVQGRYDRLYEPITSAFHMRLMVSIAAGSSWKAATSSERAELVKAFARMSVSTYASRFDGYSGQSFQTRGARASARGVQLVDTAIESPDEDPVALTYVLKDSGGDLRVVDVLLDRGISELAVRRSEFSAILKESGIRSLISALNEKSAELTGT